MKTVKRSVTLIMLTLAVTVLAILGVYFATLETGTVAENAVSAADITLTDEEKAATVGLHGDVIGGDHDHTGATPLTQTSGTLPAGNYYLENDLEVTGCLEITETVNLCLNGKKLSFSSTVPLSDGNSVILLNRVAKFSLYDCEGGGMITGGRGYQSGEDELTGGGVCLRTTYAGDATEMTMYGGAIIGNTVDSNRTWGPMVGYGGGIGILSEDSKVTIKNGLIKGNTASLGGGVYNSNGTLVVTGGIISDNVATGYKGLYGGGIYSRMSGWSTTDPVPAVVSLKNVAIVNNTGGVEFDYIAGFEQFELGDGVRMEGNTDYGFRATQSREDFQLPALPINVAGGQIIVRNNGENGANNIEMLKTNGELAYFNFTGALTAGSEFWIGKSDPGTISKNFSACHTDSSAALEYFRLDDPASELGLRDGEIYYKSINRFTTHSSIADFTYGKYTSAPVIGKAVSEGAVTVKCYTDASCTDEYYAGELSPTLSAGKYWAVSTAAATDLYDELTDEEVATFEVLPATMRVTTGNNSYLTYNGQPQNYNGVTGIVNSNNTGLTVTATIKYKLDTETEYAESLPELIHAGTHTINYEATAPNYNTATGSFTVTINKASSNYITNVTVAATYGSDYMPVTTATFGGDTATYTYSDSEYGTFTATKPTSAGNYWVRATIAETSDYYEGEGSSYQFTIAPKTIKVTIDDKTSEYGSAVLPLTVSLDETQLAYADTTADLNVTLTKADGANADTYAITGTYNNPNYAINFTDGTYTITPKTVGISWTDKTFTYDGADQSASVTATYNDISGSPVSLTVTLGGDKTEFKDAGGYEFVVDTSSVDGNYKLTGATTKAYTIAPKSLTVSWGPTTFTYDGSEQKPAASVADNDCEITVGGGQTNAGTNYTAIASTTNGNYTLTNETTTFAISKRNITVTVTATGSVYGAAIVAPTGTVTVGGIVDGDTDVYTLTTAATRTSPVGTYDVTLAASDANYNVTLSGGTDAYTVTAAEITGVDTTPNDRTYDGQAQAALGAYNATAVNGQTLTWSFKLTAAGSYSAAVPQTENAGTYTVYYRITAPNHNERTGTIIVTVAKATVKAPKLESKLYQPGVTQKAEVPESEYYAVSANEGGINKGSYEVVLALLDADNYEWKTGAGVTINGEYATVEFRIVGAQNAWVKEPTVADVTYGETVKPQYLAAYGNPMVTVTYYNAQTDEALDGVPTQAGAYKAVIAVAEAEDYTGLSVTVYFNILRKAIDVTIENKTSVYGEELVELTYTLNENELAVGDTRASLGITLTKKEVGTDAKEYTITGAWDNGNYAVTFLGGTYEITQATNRFTTEYARDGWTYNEAATAETTPAALFGDVVVKYYTDAAHDHEYTAGFAAANAGTYYVVVTVAGNANYTGLNANYEFTVAKATYAIDVTFTGASVEYDGQAHTVTVEGALPAGVSVTYYVGGEIFQSATNAGTYAITAKFTGNANYNAIEDMTATLTVTPKELTVTWSGTSFTYNGSEQKPTASVADDGCVVTVSGGQTNAGNDYTATASTDNANYTLTNTTVTFSIAKKELTVTWTGTSFTYNGSEQKPTASVADDGCVVTVTGGQTNAGNDYTATASTDNANYTLTNATTTFSIAKKELAVTWSGTSFTYNGSEQKPTASVADDGCVVTVTGGQTNAGNDYTATASTDNANYTLTNATRTFSISKRAVTVTIDGKTSVAGESLAALTSKVTSGEVVTGDDLGITLTKAEGLTAGTYDITGTATNANYEVTFVKGTYTITAASDPEPTPTPTPEPEPEKGGCGSVVPDGVTIGGIALAALVVGAILIARRKRSK